jgi:hypothetical protein
MVINALVGIDETLALDPRAALLPEFMPGAEAITRFAPLYPSLSFLCSVSLVFLSSQDVSFCSLFSFVNWQGVGLVR